MPLGVTAFVDSIAESYASLPRAGTVAASAARTTVQDFGDQETRGAVGLIVLVEVTAWTAGSITVTINGVSPTGTVYPLLTSAALVATGLVRLQVSSNLIAAANTKAQECLPDKFRIHVAVADATPITYSISAVLTLS